MSDEHGEPRIHTVFHWAADQPVRIAKEQGKDIEEIMREGGATNSKNFFADRYGLNEGWESCLVESVHECYVGSAASVAMTTDLSAEQMRKAMILSIATYCFVAGMEFSTRYTHELVNERISEMTEAITKEGAD